ncbi:hypothetical protein ABV409_09495 [Flagellimonas sp. DF-77]|uniref:hypothetical protein n=1 Tax=Flagellimonas algarum TaxID=3230298 RepID=UPI003393070F
MNRNLANIIYLVLFTIMLCASILFYHRALSLETLGVVFGTTLTLMLLCFYLQHHADE